MQGPFRARLGRRRAHQRLTARADAGEERAAAICSLIWTAQLNGLDPEGDLREVLGRIAGRPIDRIAELLPWAIAAEKSPVRATRGLKLLTVVKTVAAGRLPELFGPLRRSRIPA